MSTSEARARRKSIPRMPSTSRDRTVTPPGMPLTATRRALLEGRSDQRLRALVYDLLTIAARMDAVREHLARRMSLSGPRYSVLMAIAQFQFEGGVGVGALARLLHVSSAFIATETGKLAQMHLVQKRPNPKDRRGVILGVTRAGAALIEQNRAEICALNDEFFGFLDRKSFLAMSSAAALVVAGSGKAMGHIRMRESEAHSAMGAAAE